MPRSPKANINPQVLSWARQDAGYSIPVAAKKALVKPEQLQSWESGEDKPTIKQLRKLGKVYKRPIAVFYLENPPKDFQALNDYRQLPDHETTELSPELKFEIRRARNLREIAIDMWDGIGEPYPNYPVKADLNTDPESIAIAIREFLDINSEIQIKTPPFHPSYNLWRTSMENAGILIIQTSGIDLSEMRGFSIDDLPLPVIAVNSRDTYNGRTFTILHELAHIILHESGLCNLRETENSSADSQKIEVFCNAVAGSTLIPKSNLLNELIISNIKEPEQISDDEIRTMANRFGTSKEVLLRRMLSVGLITKELYRDKRAQFLEEYKGLLTKKPKGFPLHHYIVISKVGRLFTRLVFENYYQDKITLSDVSGFLGTKIKHLNNIEQDIFKGVQDLKAAS